MDREKLATDPEALRIVITGNEEELVVVAEVKNCARRHKCKLTEKQQ
jgi:hypothetical protein